MFWPGGLAQEQGAKLKSDANREHALYPLIQQLHCSHAENGKIRNVQNILVESLTSYQP
jgi:hypothetical protein